MKNLAYLFTALIMMTSCTMNEEDIPQPINQVDFKYESYEGSQIPANANDLSQVKSETAEKSGNDFSSEEEVKNNQEYKTEINYPKEKEYRVYTNEVATFPKRIQESPMIDSYNIKKTRLSKKKVRSFSKVNKERKDQYRVENDDPQSLSIRHAEDKID